MTAEGILYVDERCRDVFKKELDKIFGEDKWRLDGSNYGHIWNVALIPPELSIEVLSIEDDDILGVIIIENKYEQTYDQMQDCMYLEPYPYRIKNVFDWKDDKIK
jgi:hypothetical protein